MRQIYQADLGRWVNGLSEIVGKESNATIETGAVLVNGLRLQVIGIKIETQTNNPRGS